VTDLLVARVGIEFNDLEAEVKEIPYLDQFVLEAPALGGRARQIDAPNRSRPSAVRLGRRATLRASTPVDPVVSRIEPMPHLGANGQTDSGLPTISIGVSRDHLAGCVS
jgi:hypothetical protein